MINSNSNFFVTEYIEDLNSQIEFILEGQTYKSIKNSNLWEHWSVCGIDRNLENPETVYDSNRFASFCIVHQTKIENKNLIKKEFDRIHNEDYYSMVLTREQKRDINHEAFNNVVHLFQTKTSFIDVIIDIANRRIFVESKRDSVLFPAINRLKEWLGLDSLFVRPWFDANFSERIGLSSTHQFFLIWLYKYTASLNTHHVYRGKSVEFITEKTQFSVRGDKEEVDRIWQSAEKGRWIKSISLVFKLASSSDIPDDKSLFDPNKLWDRFKLKLKKDNYGFFEYNSNSNETIDAVKVADKLSSLNLLINEFDSLITEFQRIHQGIDMNKAYEELTKNGR